MGQDMNIKRIQDTLTRGLRQPISGFANVYEFMVHPGFRATQGEGGCGDGPDDFALSQDREHEMELLLCGELRDLLTKEGFRLCSYKDIP